MTEQELIKKKSKRRPSLKNAGHSKPRTQKTLAHIVLRNGSRVEIPELLLNFSELTTYDNLRIALEHAGLAISWLNHLARCSTPRLTLTVTVTMEPIRLNLEDLMNHLYCAVEAYDRQKGRS